MVYIFSVVVNLGWRQHFCSAMKGEVYGVGWAIKTSVRLQYLVAIPRICQVASKKPREDKDKGSKDKQQHSEAK